MKALELPGPAISEDRAAGVARGPCCRFVGVDAGAETIKMAEVLAVAGQIKILRREILEHGKRPGPCLLQLWERWNGSGAGGAAVTGRFSAARRFRRFVLLFGAR
jgi:hypothetical protein